MQDGTSEYRIRDNLRAAGDDMAKTPQDCFIICPLSGEQSETRKRADQLLKHILVPVLDANGYVPVRADQVPKVGLITSQIINLIIDSPLVIADLTGSNPNVFYELAIRHAIRKPYIQIINRGDKIPFDIGAVRTIEFDIGDLDSVEKAKIEIERQIKEFDKGHKPDSPISIASTAHLLQHDRDLAGEITDRLTHVLSYLTEGYGYCADAEALNTILRKVYCLRDYGCLDFEDLDKKLDLILSKLDKPNKAFNATS